MTPLSSGISSDPVTDWATVLNKSKSVHWNGALDFHRPGIHPRNSRCIRLQKSVKISIEDVSSSTNKWNCALIAQILGDNSSLHAVKNFAESKWNDSGLLEVQELDNDLFVFRFQSEEYKNQVLEESVVFNGGRTMYLMPWVPNKPIQKLTLETVPIWIKLPGLGLQYFTVQALSKLGSLIGRPLFADKDTIDQSRLSYARMCVEIKADDEKLPNVIFFINEFGVEIGQDVEYEWVPRRCSFCKLFGHDTNFCTKSNMPGPEAEGDSLDDEEASSEDEEISEDNEIPLPKKMKVSRNENELGPCGIEKKYKRRGSVAGRSSCIEIPLPLPQVDDERKKVFEDVDKDRRFAIDASIVRIMKSRKVLGYQQLVMECREQLGHIFKPDVKVIKQRIEDLICREYLERDKENPNMFKYLP